MCKFFFNTLILTAVEFLQKLNGNISCLPIRGKKKKNAVSVKVEVKVVKS